MGTFRVEVGIGNPLGGDLRPVSALVDTGATHSVMPETLLRELRLTPLRRSGFRVAGGGRVEYGVGEARFRVEGQVRTCPVVFGPNAQYLLGATTLDIFQLMVYPTSPNPSLVPVADLYL